MKTRQHVPREPIADAATYVCPACGRRTVLAGRLVPGMLVRRRCKCKTDAAGGNSERTMVEVSAHGVRVVAAGEGEPEGMIEMRCEWCKKLLCKVRPAPGGRISVRCWRNPCMRMNDLTCACGAGEGAAPGGVDRNEEKPMDSQKTCFVSERNGQCPRRTACQTSTSMAISARAMPATPSKRF
jgi:hypothetical protein